MKLEKVTIEKEQKSGVKKWKRIGRLILFPHGLIKITLVVISVLSMYYAFGIENPDLVISCAGYTVSAYTLMILVAEVPGIVKKIKERLYANRYMNRYLTDRDLRVKISLYTGLGISYGFACLKLVAGYYYKSYWFAGIGVYYMVISLMRYLLLRGDRHGIKVENGRKQRIYGLKCYRFSGYFTFLLNIAVSGLVIQLVYKNETYSYPGVLIFAFAAYAFYSLIMAVVSVARYRKLVNPVYSAAKMLSLASAMVSMLALQTAMLTEFSGAGEGQFIRQINLISGSVVCIFIFGMAVWMIKRANTELEKMQ